MSSKTLNKLKNYGYSRQDKPIIEHENRTFCKKNFKEKLLNHSIMEHTPIKECNFDLAAITGSIYRHCTFIDNSFQETDFEFCEFMECKFWNKEPISCSYNNSNFINTDFYDIEFDSCTFTNAYFENCHFIGGRISFSTLENAIFKDCFFKDMDLRYLNMDYIELNDPHMENVVLPMAQIPFMYGGLQYLNNTKDSVKISKGKINSITPKEYFSNVIPLMEQHFAETKQYFPLANIHIALGRYDLALNALKEGLSISVENRDFRMLKYYCCLIAQSGCFKPGDLHMFYNNICRLSPQGKENLNEQRNFVRHIGEIKSILFSSNPLPNLNITFRTNIVSQNISELSKVLEALFTITKTNIGYGGNQIEMLVSENSPLIIELKINGTEKALIALLSAFIKLTNEEQNALISLPTGGLDSSFTNKLYVLTDEYCTKIKELSVSLCLLEYYLENFTEYSFNNKTCYYYNNFIENKAYASLSLNTV